MMRHPNETPQMKASNPREAVKQMHLKKLQMERIHLANDAMDLANDARKMMKKMNLGDEPKNSADEDVKTAGKWRIKRKNSVVIREISEFTKGLVSKQLAATKW